MQHLAELFCFSTPTLYYAFKLRNTKLKNIEFQLQGFYCSTGTLS